MKKAKNEKETSRISKEEGKQGTLFTGMTLAENKSDLKTTRIQHITKGIPFTIKL